MLRVESNKRMQMIRHKHKAPQPSTTLRSTLTVFDDGAQHRFPSQKLPPFMRASGHKIDRMIREDFIEPLQPSHTKL